MKGKLFLIAASTLLLMMSYSSNESVPSLSIDQDTKQIVFFSDEEEYEKEVSYYDAIIQLKREYPEAIKNMKIFSSSEMDDYFTIFHIDRCPALVVYHHNQVIVEIKGDVTTEEIVAPVSKALSQR